MGVVGDSASPAAGLFHRRMLWRERDRIEPVVALLGPSGAGKTTALRALVRECGGTVVHASLDFAAHDVEPIPAAAMVTFEMKRGWTNRRRDPTFHRFGLGLLALNEKLPDDRAKARDRIKELIRSYVRNTGAGETAAQMERAAGAIVDVVAAGALSHIGAGPTGDIVESVRDRAKPVIGSLLQSSARWGMRDALRWWSDLLVSTSDIDAMINLSRGNRASATGHLMRALLADIRDNAVNHPPMRSACTCLMPDHPGRPLPHDHSWMLLVDNADTLRGRRFLAELAAARSWRAMPPDGGRAESDPLLVVAAYGEWRAEWARRWCEPWRTQPHYPQQRIPLFSRATHDLWARNSASAVAAGEPTACWYPVWLDPMDADQTARRLDLRATDLKVPELGELVHRLSAGHPGVVTTLEAEAEAGVVRAEPVETDGTVPDDEVVLDARKLMRARGERTATPLWQRSAESLLPGRVGVRPWTQLPQIVTAGAYLADRQNVRDGQLPPDMAELSTVLESLRRRLWISTFAARPSRLWPVARGDAGQPAMLHPWLARCLLFGLADASGVRRPTGGRDPWDGLFLRLAAALNTAGPADGGRDGTERTALDREARRLYYELARGEFAGVTAALAERFDQHDHREWLRLLDDVTTAPCGRLAHAAPADLYETLLDEVTRSPLTPVQVTSAKLVALLWLGNDSLTPPDRRWDAEVHEALGRLAHNSTRLDVGPLEEAAARFAS